MNQTYDARFFARQEDESLVSARAVLRRLFGLWRPASVLDIGCGVGTWLAACEELGIADFIGVDGDWVPAGQLLIGEERFRARDLSETINLGRRFDLAICVEVAEHLPLESAAKIVVSLTRHADAVLFSAALPFQGGDGHVNENWMEFWSSLFDRAGFEAVDILRDALWMNGDVAWWYRQNMVVFRSRAARSSVLPGISASDPASRIHPEAYLNAVHRTPRNPLSTSRELDTAYYRSLSSKTMPDKVLSYGSEFDYSDDKSIEVVHDFSELCRLAPEIGSPVLTDALADIIPRDPPLPPLVRGESVPDFIGIGVQKSATSWLARLLAMHPDITMPGGKEVNFFNRRAFAPESAYSGSWVVEKAETTLRQYVANAAKLDPGWVKACTHMVEHDTGQQWYEALFRFYPQVALRGEITPEYAQLRGREIDELLVFAPNARIVLMLRDPIERITSQMRMLGDQVVAARPFLDEIARRRSVVERSRYERIIENWRGRLDPEQLLIITAPELESDPKGLVTRVSGFLGFNAEKLDQAKIGERHFSSKYDYDMSVETRAYLLNELDETFRFLREQRLG